MNHRPIHIDWELSCVNVTLDPAHRMATLYASCNAIRIQYQIDNEVAP